MEEEYETESKNGVKIALKQSSSSGKLGYDIIITTDGKVTQADLDKMAEMALTTALKVRTKIQ